MSNIQVDNLENRTCSVENFADKYIPLLAQNITCDTLTQVLGQRERKKLELYEQKIFQNLHDKILDDSGVPDLENHRKELLEQINKKLAIIKKILDERKLLVSKSKVKEIKKKAKSRKEDHSHVIENPNFLQLEKSTKKVLVHDDTSLQEDYDDLSSSEKELQEKKLQSQAKIKQMQSTMNAININRVDSQELAELQSVDSSKIDYIEIFDQRINEINVKISPIPEQFTRVDTLIENTANELRNDTRKVEKKAEEYFNSIYTELDGLRNLLKNSQNHNTTISKKLSSLEQSLIPLEPLNPPMPISSKANTNISLVLPGDLNKTQRLVQKSTSKYVHKHISSGLPSSPKRFRTRNFKVVGQKHFKNSSEDRAGTRFKRREQHSIHQIPKSSLQKLFNNTEGNLDVTEVYSPKVVGISSTISKLPVIHKNI